ncbi:CHRD domain-containing protein [Streptomyces nigra]|uniref:CHRD domain-containing protein n=1 Tax=Streptomyces nigra TaxID=1827580 RepID=UPI003456959B
MRQPIIAASAAAVLGALTAGPAVAHGGHGDHGAQTTVKTAAQQITPARGKATFLKARLSGDQEVPTAGQSSAGDEDGSGEALIEVKGDRVIFSLRWSGIGAPTLGHIHEGRAGTNGDVRVPLFTTAMPDTVTKAVGSVTVTDKALAQKLRTNPAGFYVNLHDAANPAGAVRGQLRTLRGQQNPLGLSREAGLAAVMTGGQEVPNEDPAKVGDPDGAAVTFLRPSGSNVGFNMTWVNLTPPTLGHIHKGKFGQNGPVQIPLFTSPIPQNIFSVGGTVGNQDAATVTRIRQNPSNYYSNLHTAEKPEGAVRGQLIGKGGAQKPGNGESSTSPVPSGAPSTEPPAQGENGSSPASPSPVRGNALLFDDPGTFSESNASQGVSGTGCTDVPRPRIASALQTDSSIVIWSGPKCTGESKVVRGDVLNLADEGFDNKITSVFFGAGL